MIKHVQASDSWYSLNRMDFTPPGSVHSIPAYLCAAVFLRGGTAP